MNKKGMIGFPMRLAVTFLILAIFVPVALGMVSSLEKDSATSAATAEAGRIEDTVKRIYYSGVGSADTVRISLSGGSSLVLGGEGSDSYCITVLLDDSVAEKVYLQRPSVKFLGDPVYLTGNKTIQITCAVENGVYGVGVSIVD